jgi:hypothetical protein
MLEKQGLHDCQVLQLLMIGLIFVMGDMLQQASCDHDNADCRWLQWLCTASSSLALLSWFGRKTKVEWRLECHV